METLRRVNLATRHRSSVVIRLREPSTIAAHGKSLLADRVVRPIECDVSAVLRAPECETKMWDGEIGARNGQNNDFRTTSGLPCAE